MTNEYEYMSTLVPVGPLRSEANILFRVILETIEEKYKLTFGSMIIAECIKMNIYGIENLTSIYGSDLIINLTNKVFDLLGKYSYDPDEVFIHYLIALRMVTKYNVDGSVKYYNTADGIKMTDPAIIKQKMNEYGFNNIIEIKSEIKSEIKEIDISI
jgi:hypothetical protein